MTHSVNAPFPPPATTPPASPTSTQGIEGPAGSSTQDAARNEAANVGQSAKEAGGQVASTAADQAKEVADVTKRQAQDLLQQGRGQLREQATAQQQKAAQGLSALASELRSLADGTSDGAPGPARDLLDQAAGSVGQFASWLENREPAELLDEVRSFARRRPGAFLLGAAAAGILAGRLTSGVKAAHSDGPSERNVGGRSLPPGGNYVDPTPAYSGTPTAAGGTGTPTPAVGTGTPLPPPPYGTAAPTGSAVPPATATGWDDPARGTGEVR